MKETPARKAVRLLTGNPDYLENDSKPIDLMIFVWLGFVVFLITMLVTCSSPAHADKIIIKGDSKNPCGCTRESKDNVCVAYYQLKDEGFDVKVTCPKKEI